MNTVLLLIALVAALVVLLFPLYALGTTLLTLAIAVPAAHAAHALSRYRFRVTALLVGSLLVAQILPSIVIANSLFLVYHRLHLLNSYTWRTFTRIVLPMSRSAVITVALFAFLNGWGDFIFALTLLNGNTFEPVTLSIYTYIGEFSQSWEKPWRSRYSRCCPPPCSSSPRSGTSRPTSRSARSRVNR